MVSRVPSLLRTIGLLLLAFGPLAFATVEATRPQQFHARDAAFDDTTVGSAAHPQQVSAGGSQQRTPAIGLAKHHWGANPCGGQEENECSGLASGINAHCSWM